MADDTKTGFWQTVPGILTAVAAIITAVAGLLLALYQAGFLGGTKSPTNANPASAASTTGTASVVSTPNAVSESSQSREDDAPPAIGRGNVQVNISGKWRDAEGTYYEIRQEGNRFIGEANFQGIVSRGSGTLNGREYSSTYTRFTNPPSQGNCRGTVSADGNRIISTCSDSLIGDFPTKMYRY